MKIKFGLKIFAFLFIMGFMFSGCLTVQYKVYNFKINKDGSGTLTITYKNIMSQVSSQSQDSIAQEINSDFASLLTDYVAGSQIEKEYPNAKVVKKELYEENGVLNGKVVIEFDNPAQVGLFKYDKRSPYTMCMGSSMTESYFDSNGKYDKDLNVVAWDRKMKELTLVTLVTEPGDDTYGLLDMWKSMKK